MRKQSKCKTVNIKEITEVTFGKEKPTIGISCCCPFDDNICAITLTPLNEDVDFGKIKQNRNVNADIGVALLFYRVESIDIFIEALNTVKTNWLKSLEDKK